MKGNSTILCTVCRQFLSSAFFALLSKTTTTLFVLVLFIILSFIITKPTNTYATASTLTISVADNISLNITSINTTGTFAHSDTTTPNISIKTTNGSGYTLGIKASTEGSDALINTTDNTKTIPSITASGGISEATYSSNTSYNNTWGFRPSKLNSANNTNYLPAPTSSTNTTILDTTTTANPTTNNNYNIAIGTRVNSNTIPGSYTNSFVITAVVNPIPYTITYNKNTTDTVNNMPANGSGNTYSETVNISSTAPTRVGYNFKGWCTVQVADDVSCTGTTYNPNGGGTNLAWATNQTATSNSLSLYANWEEITIEKAYALAGKTKYNGYYKLQDMTTSICNITRTGSNMSQLIDVRDNEVYYVSKLKDNKCWLLDNLRLGGGSTISLDSSNTNIPGNYNLPASICNTYTTGCINASYKNNIPTHYGNSSGKRGVYYNYCAASGGTYCYSSSTANASYDICPKNWRMPTGGGSGEFSTLCNAITGLDCSEDKDVPMQGTNPNTFQYQLGLSDTGYIDPGLSSNPVDVNTRTLIWASTYQRNNAVMMGVSASGTYTNAAGGGYRHLLFTVRCLAK